MATSTPPSPSRTAPLGEDVVVMEHAVQRGRADHPVVAGDAVLIGPHAHLDGTVIVRRMAETFRPA